MTLLIFASGVIIGLLVSVIVLVLTKKYETIITEYIEHPLKSSDKAYISGLSEEESDFRASLLVDKQVQIL